MIGRRDAVLEEFTESGELPEMLAADTRYAEIETLLREDCSTWSVSPDLARLLARAIIGLGLSSVLEFGAGLSSLVLATSLSRLSGGKLTSVEQNLCWCRGQWRRVSDLVNVDSRIVESKPRLSLSAVGVCYSFRDAADIVASEGPYDLVLIDAPQGFYGRDGALQMASRHLAPGALVVLDDAGRSGERWALFRSLATTRGYKLLFYDEKLGGRGCAILRWCSDGRIRPSLLAVSTSAVQAVRYARERRRRQAEIVEWV
ncbi:MAG: class I SAM-dependent methyltransferase [Candidatus Eisenbacteria sp.]|nr:class I SAM-dependent methyltransferase [Candidatus Eisenbacteria bacterium]